MKKVILKILVGFIVAIIVLQFNIAIYADEITDLQQEEKFITEITEIVESSNSQDLDIDALRERLNTTKTRGDYAVLERAAKQYFLDVLDNNADEINGNNYVWEINEENYYDKPIYIQIDKRSFNVEDLILIISIIVGILLLALVIFIIMRFRYKNINKL